LANTPQAKKRARQNDNRRVHNHAIRTRMRTAIKGFLKAVDAKDKDAANAAYKATVSFVDRVVSKGLHHRNRAARLKSRLNTRLRNMA